MSIEKRLQAAGLLGLPFSWGSDGSITFGEAMTTQQRADVQAVFDDYTPPPQPVPAAVTMRQARLALLGVGKLADVNAAIAAMQGPAGEAARIEWEYSQEVQRDKALVLALAPVLGLSDAELDALFVAAAAL